MARAADPSTPHWVLHVDLDEFLAAVEVLRRPELAGLPVVVGGQGDPTQRGVVSTASYEARAFGVGSGMPLRTAARRCPDAVFLPVDKPAYDEASAVVMATLRSFAVPVEVLGWDEAFLAVQTPDPVLFAERVRSAVLDAAGLHCSVGIGDNKLQAKIATGFGKPRGVGRLSSQTWFEVMGDQPTTALWGIGGRTAARLAHLDIHTVSQLAETPARLLAQSLGPTMGPWYRRLGRGVDSSPVDPAPWVARSHGRETTFAQNVSDWGVVAETVRQLAAQVTTDVIGEGRTVARVAMKLRYAPFETHSRSMSLPTPTEDARVVCDSALQLLGRFDQTRSVRLVGVRGEMGAPAG